MKNLLKCILLGLVLLLAATLRTANAGIGDCSKAEKKVEAQLKSINAEVNSVDNQGISKKYCTMLRLNMLSEWILRQCINDDAVPQEAKVEFKRLAGIHSKNGIAYKQSVHAFATNATCNTSDLSWTKINY